MSKLRYTQSFDYHRRHVVSSITSDCSESQTFYAVKSGGPV